MSARSHGIHRFLAAGAVALLLALPGAAQAQHGGHHGGGHGSSHHSSGSHHSGGHRSGAHHSGGRHYGGGHLGSHLSFNFHHHGYPYSYPYNYRYGYPYYYPYGTPYYRGYGGSYGSSYPDAGAMGALDLDVRPGRTAVYDEGQYLGTVDDFDGFPAYLWLPPGTHELTFHLEGYRTLVRRYSIAPGRIVQVEDVLERGESVSPEDLGTEDRRWNGPPSSRRQELGRLRVEVTPRDASVYLDGRFVGTGEELAAAPDLRVKPGEHVLEVVRPGYETQTRRFTVTPGDSLNQQMELDQR